METGVSRRQTKNSKRKAVTQGSNVVTVSESVAHSFVEDLSAPAAVKQDLTVPISAPCDVTPTVVGSASLSGPDKIWSMLNTLPK